MRALSENEYAAGGSPRQRSNHCDIDVALSFSVGETITNQAVPASTCGCLRRSRPSVCILLRIVIEVYVVCVKTRMHDMQFGNK